VTADGSPAPGRTRGFRAEPGRYHLYVSYACPWAHRTLIFRVLKKLEDIVSVSVVHHFMGKDGWTFLAEDGATGDDLYGLDFLHQIYTRADPHYTGRVTVPVLWDRRQETIVSNESPEIIRMLKLGLRRMG
jgi:putative glutathione S-transferase